MKREPEDSRKYESITDAFGTWLSHHSLSSPCRPLQLFFDHLSLVVYWTPMAPDWVTLSTAIERLPKAFGLGSSATRHSGSVLAIILATQGQVPLQRYSAILCYLRPVAIIASVSSLFILCALNYGK
jgi:hypothetical protein